VKSRIRSRTCTATAEPENRLRRSSWSTAARWLTISEDGRGEYVLEEIPLTQEALRLIDLRPEQIATFLRSAVERGDLVMLPDLRE
jgi:hypothetical protein